MEKRLLKLTPLTEATFYILVAFVNPLHGYGVIKKVEELTNQRLKLAAGTLYGVINTLISNKLITLVSEEKSNKQKKSYQITSDGLELLKYEIKRLEEMALNGRNEVL